MSRKTILWGLALLIAGTASAGAQMSSAAGIGGLLQRETNGPWKSITRFDPALQLSNAWGRLNGEATLRSTTKGTQFEQGNIGLVAETPAWNGLRISSTAAIERLNALPGFSNRRGAAGAALSYGHGGSGAWVGVESERSFALSGYDGGVQLRTGVWHQFRAVMVAVSSASHSARSVTFFPEHIYNPPDSLLRQIIQVPDSTGRMHDSVVISSNGDRTSAGSSTRISTIHDWSDLDARLSWSIGRVALDGRFGLQRDLTRDSISRSSSSLLWGHATATVAIAQHLSLIAAFGTQPARSWVGIPGARFASLGVRVAPAILSRPAAPPYVQPVASRFVLRPAETGSYVVTIRVPLARSVELSGDFNGWHPITLREVSPDVWEATLPLVPGTYHVNMRVNGASWIAPPGLSETADEFNGTVGLLVVR